MKSITHRHQKPFGSSASCKPGRHRLICQASAQVPSTSSSRNDGRIEVDRRQALAALALATWVAQPAFAEETATTEAAATPAASIAPAISSVLSNDVFEDDEYTLYPPRTFDYIDIPIPRVERGPTPERSPVRCRFEAKEQQGGTTAVASLSVVARSAQTLSFTLLQVNDISAYGTPEDAAKLIVPKGSRLIASSSQSVELPPKETPVGTIEVPPKNYYLYDILTPKGERIVMSAAASRGKVLVCGGAAPTAVWSKFEEPLTEAIKSFRVK